MSRDDFIVLALVVAAAISVTTTKIFTIHALYETLLCLVQMIWVSVIHSFVQ